VTWSPDFVVVKTPNHEYTVNDMAQLYADLGFGYNTPALEHVQVRM
jgi:hypothetical protein